MTKKYDYSDYAYTRTKRTAGCSVFGRSAAVAAVVAVAAICVVLIFNGNFTSSLSVALEGKTCYAVGYGSFAAKDKAQSYAKIVFRRGGAGYVCFDGDGYYALAAAYDDKSDAYKVEQNLKAAGEDVSTVVLSVPRKNIKLDGSRTDAELFHKGVDMLYDVFTRCNALAAAADDGEKISLTALSADITAVADKLTDDRFKTLEGLLSKALQNVSALMSEPSSAGLRFVALSAFLSLVEL